MTETQKQQLEALAAIADYATNKEVISKEESRELNTRLDVVLAELNLQDKFFKRLL